MAGEFKKPDVVAGCMRLGKWGANFSTAQYQAFIEECLSDNINTFDHADIYGDYTTEADFGEALKGNSSLRTQIQIITKCGIQHPCENRPQYKNKGYDSSAKYIKWSVENSLKNFNTDYIDLLLIHRPDYLMNFDEIGRAFFELQVEGKVKSFGVSNFTTEQFWALNDCVSSGLITNQVEISLLHRNAFEDGTLIQCQELSIRPMAWSPLAGGAFNGNEKSQKMIERMSNEMGITPSALLYAFLAKHPSKIIPVTGTTKPYRVKEALDAQKIELTNQQWYELWQAAAGQEIA